MSTRTKYIEIKSADIPKGVRFDVQLHNQGQIVEKAYGTFDQSEAGPGDPYMRIIDYSETPKKRTTYYKLLRP